MLMYTTGNYAQNKMLMTIMLKQEFYECKKDCLFSSNIRRRIKWRRENVVSGKYV